MQPNVATRSPALARRQTQWVMQALQAVHPDLKCSEIVTATKGDKVLDKSFPEIGGKGLFTKDLEVELLSGNLDVAVHPLKDLPIEAERQFLTHLGGGCAVPVGAFGRPREG